MAWKEINVENQRKLFIQLCVEINLRWLNFVVNLELAGQPVISG